jgi:hypothetical protein
MAWAHALQYLVQPVREQRDPPAKQQLAGSVRAVPGRAQRGMIAVYRGDRPLVQAGCGGVPPAHRQPHRHRDCLALAGGQCGTPVQRGTFRPGWNREGWAYHPRRPAPAGKEATPGSVDRGTGLAAVRGES